MALFLDQSVLAPMPGMLMGSRADDKLRALPECSSRHFVPYPTGIGHTLPPYPRVVLFRQLIELKLNQNAL